MSSDAEHPPTGEAREARRDGAKPRARLGSVDALRGLVIVLMALDHARDALAPAAFVVENPDDSTPWWFFTRWVTHLCAPIFVLLAGAGSWLWLHRGRSRAQLSGLLITRGVWLILIEFLWIGLWWQLPFGVLWRGWDSSMFYGSGWPLTYPPGAWIAQVLWAIGVGMIVLAALVWLPRWAIASIALAIIAGHNILDHSRFEIPTMTRGGFLRAPRTDYTLGEYAWLALHQGGFVLRQGARPFMLLYPVLPWIGVMALGYALAPVLRWESVKRVRALVVGGLALLVVFAILRAWNIYGDPEPWTSRTTLARSMMAFLQLEKYPPSLQFLLATLGLGALLLAALERGPSMVRSGLSIFGRVPFLFYVLHLPLLWLMAAVYTRLVFVPRNHATCHTWAITFPNGAGTGYTTGLWQAYVGWIVAVVVLGPLCWWFGRLKQRSRAWWLTYL